MTRITGTEGSLRSSKDNFCEEFSLNQEYETIIKNFELCEQDAYVGLYSDFYYERDHINYYGVFEILGPILISLLEDELFYHVLVRSVIGFKNLKFEKSSLYVMKCMEIFILKLSLDQYFMGIYKEKWSLEQEENQKKSRLGFLNLFSFDSHTRAYSPSLVPEDFSETATVSTFSSGSSKQNLERVRAQVLLSSHKFSSLNVVKQLIQIRSKHFFEIAELDELNNDSEISVDVVVD